MAGAALGLSACVSAVPAGPGSESADFAPDYLGIDTRLLDDDLTQFLVEMRGARGPFDIEDYADCAAAQYALIRGHLFARKVRVQTDVTSGISRGDGVYVISPGLPRGARTIDAEVTVRDCAARGIPTV